MSEAINLFTQYSQLRAARRAELAAAGKTEAEINEALRYVVPALIRPHDSQTEQSELSEEGLQTDSRWDVPDSEGALPDATEAEQMVVARLAANHRAFHGEAGDR